MSPVHDGQATNSAHAIAAMSAEPNVICFGVLRVLRRS
jgi:hypothetical protein